MASDGAAILDSTLTDAAPSNPSPADRLALRVAAPAGRLPRWGQRVVAGLLTTYLAPLIAFLIAAVRLDHRGGGAVRLGKMHG